MNLGSDTMSMYSRGRVERREKMKRIVRETVNTLLGKSYMFIGVGIQDEYLLTLQPKAPH